MKGDSESHPSLSPEDEFADFETWDKGSFGSAKEEGMIPKEYAREAWKRGMAYEVKIKKNPFKFGVVGSTDSHTGLPTTQENNFFGKISQVEPSGKPVRFQEKVTGILKDPKGRDFTIRHYKASASGLAGVWARENTREDIWDAISRKEIFGTTGTRLRIRIFCGAKFKKDDIHMPNFAEYGYKHGVPMGGDLKNNGDYQKIGCMVQAARDPDGANLDRIQLIKGWLDKEGKTHEKIFNVAWSNDRKQSSSGTIPAVGNTVNVKEATYQNTIGAPFLTGYWQDTEFNPEERAFYYIRVLEIPTPRWTTYDAKVFGVKIPEDVPTSIQERAYSSPIWYTPKE